MSCTRNILTASALASALMAGACSSSSSVGGPAQPATRHRAAAAGVTAPGGAPSKAGVDLGGADFWCAEFARAGESVAALGGSSTTSPGAFLPEAQKLTNDAPAAIKPDLKALLAIDKKIVAGDAGAEAQVGTPSVLAHVRHFATWLRTNCKNVHIPLPALPSTTR